MERAKSAFNDNKKEVGQCKKNKDEAGAQKAMESAAALKAKVAELETEEVQVHQRPCHSAWKGAYI